MQTNNSHGLGSPVVISARLHTIKIEAHTIPAIIPNSKGVTVVMEFSRMQLLHSLLHADDQ